MNNLSAPAKKILLEMVSRYNISQNCKIDYIDTLDNYFSPKTYNNLHSESKKTFPFRFLFIIFVLSSFTILLSIYFLIFTTYSDELYYHLKKMLYLSTFNCFALILFNSKEQYLQKGWNFWKYCSFKYVTHTYAKIQRYFKSKNNKEFEDNFIIHYKEIKHWFTWFESKNKQPELFSLLVDEMKFPYKKTAFFKTNHLVRTLKQDAEISHYNPDFITHKQLRKNVQNKRANIEKNPKSIQFFHD